MIAVLITDLTGKEHVEENVIALHVEGAWLVCHYADASVAYVPAHMVLAVETRPVGTVKEK